MEVKITSQERDDVRNALSSMSLADIDKNMSRYGYSDEEIGRSITATLKLYKALRENGNGGPRPKFTVYQGFKETFADSFCVPLCIHTGDDCNENGCKVSEFVLDNAVEIEQKG